MESPLDIRKLLRKRITDPVIPYHEAATSLGVSVSTLQLIERGAIAAPAKLLGVLRRLGYDDVALKAEYDAFRAEKAKKAGERIIASQGGDAV